ncbi:MAG: DUF411 domain-containing protein [Woeseiaceae bacterium]|nr:DUF411 domain-containing protein [Woeseiaceae bacterium]
MNRFLQFLIGLFLSTLVWADDPATDTAVESTHVVMHKNPGCGCCDLWADHLRSHGFTVASTEDPQILAFKASHNIPRPLMSCHTAVIDGYFVEGHVPANDILKLLREKPEHVTGIAVPGMPLGSPGMEHPRPQDFNTIALLSDGTAYVFESHKAGEDFSGEESE